MPKQSRIGGNIKLTHLWRRPWKILLPAIDLPQIKRPNSIVILVGFGGVIILGTILLLLPISTKIEQSPHVIDALFTATSAVCVTGLVVVDTADYWSLFGQIVILVLIQLGGFGFMTSATLFLLALRRRIGLKERLLIGESIGVLQLGGVVKIVRNMAIFTIVAELLGAAIFYLHFSGEATSKTTIWQSLFHSISAFNNAGFDLFGNFRSISIYQKDTLLLLTTAALIIIGGISYLVIADIIAGRKRKNITLDTKIVLSTTLFLLSLGTLVFFFTEFNNMNTLGELPVPLKLLNAFFQAVTARTAGFSTIEVSNLANYAIVFLMVLMFIGGASGSTAGGIKVNTFGMLTATILSTIRGKEHAGIFGREFSSQQINKALTIIMLSMGIIALSVLLLTITEKFHFVQLFFESVSAFGTVGLSFGITPQLTVFGKIIISLTMFAGRLGPLTLALALTQKQQPTYWRYPEEIIRLG